MSKKSNIKFNSNNAKCFLKCIALTEGRMTKAYMEKLGSKRLANQLIKENYVKKNRDGSYSSTDKLLKQYKDTFRTTKRGFSYNTSVSAKHSNGEARILTCINKSTLLTADIKTAKELTEEHKRFKKTDAYKISLENYKRSLEKEYQKIANRTDVENYLKKIDLEARLELLNSNHASSPPDFAINNFPTTDLDKMVAKMKYSLHNDNFTSKEEAYFCRAIDQIKKIREQAIEREQEVVNMTFEVITISYSEEAIREKEIYSHITNTDIIYIYEGGE